MRRGERITTIQRIAEALQGSRANDLGLTLRSFGVSTGDPSWDEEHYELTTRALESATDETLQELAEHVLPGDFAVPRHEGTSAPDPWQPGMFRLFLSHTSAHKKEVRELRKLLGRWGVDAFVAHDAIEPSREWVETIEQALRTSDALCAVLTKDFLTSKWCDQEVGYAVGVGTVILPLKFAADPHGFIGKFQALPVSLTAFGGWWAAAADGIVDALLKNPRTATSIAPSIVKRYATSGSFDRTRETFPALSQIPANAWTTEMIEEVREAANSNSQVKQANLPGPRPIPAAAEAVISKIIASREDLADPRDDDIPF